jgi:signal transduction histidine kinase
MSLTACPPPPADTRPAAPENLAYSFTLPSALTSPALARAATRILLAAHRLHGMLDAAVQVVGELAATACRFTPAPDIYVSLRYRDSALRVSVYDHHPRHVDGHLAAACDARRRAALRLLACVVRARGGDWGFNASREPGGGTRMWVTLPHARAAAYGV